MLFVPALIAAFASSTAAMAAVAVVSDNINKNKIRVVPPEKKDLLMKGRICNGLFTSSCWPSTWRGDSDVVWSRNDPNY